MRVKVKILVSDEAATRELLGVIWTPDAAENYIVSISE